MDCWVREGATVLPSRPARPRRARCARPGRLRCGVPETPRRQFLPANPER